MSFFKTKIYSSLPSLKLDLNVEILSHKASASKPGIIGSSWANTIVKKMKIKNILNFNKNECDFLRFFYYFKLSSKRIELRFHNIARAIRQRRRFLWRFIRRHSRYSGTGVAPSSFTSNIGFRWWCQHQRFIIIHQISGEWVFWAGCDRICWWIAGNFVGRAGLSSERRGEQGHWRHWRGRTRRAIGHGIDTGFAWWWWCSWWLFSLRLEEYICT